MLLLESELIEGGASASMAEISGLFSIDCDGITFSSTDGASGFWETFAFIESFDSGIG